MARLGFAFSRLTLADVTRDRRGSTLAMMAVGLIPAVAALGSAIDMGRMYVVKSQLQAGVDAAALAGARAFEISAAVPEGRDAQVDAYFGGNFATGYMGTTNLRLTKTFTVVNDRNTTNISAAVVVPMTFMRIFGLDQQEVIATAQAENQPHPLEVMLILDNTGSLSTMLPPDKNGVVQTRMAALKSASKSFFDILYQGAPTRSDLALGMITYAVTVNVGDLLTSWKTASVEQQFGFNDPLMYATLGKWPANTLAWKGCVMADSTIKTMSTNLAIKDAGAWDIGRSLPGEGTHPPLKPWFVPPFWVPKDNAAAKASPTSLYYKFHNGDAGYNLYKLNATYADQMLNPDKYGYADTSPYRRWFYQFYIGLNNGAGANANDDVITTTSGGYYNPSTMAGQPFLINYARMPYFADWKTATTGQVNPRGGMYSAAWNVDRTDPPNPNWTCPEPAVPVAYGRPKSFYYDQIDQKNGAIYPANGTLHHAGLLWGYRLLVRDDVFTRAAPARSEAPKRAIVFMTDGETGAPVGGNGAIDRGWSFYGNYADSPISAAANGMKAATELRFAKVCRAIQNEPNPPKVYIISLTTTDTATLNMFETCAPGHVYRTADTASLKAAFDDVASELVDLHLVK